MPETLDDRPWFMFSTFDELINEPLGDRPWFMQATVDELLVDIKDRPWFMTAEVENVLQPPLEKLLGGREDEVDVFSGKRPSEQEADSKAFDGKPSGEEAGSKK